MNEWMDGAPSCECDESLLAKSERKAGWTAVMLFDTV
jgi:hypothetical protein